MAIIARIKYTPLETELLSKIPAHEDHLGCTLNFVKNYGSLPFIIVDIKSPFTIIALPLRCELKPYKDQVQSRYEIDNPLYDKSINNYTYHEPMPYARRTIVRFTTHHNRWMLDGRQVKFEAPLFRPGRIYQFSVPRSFLEI